MNKVKQSLLLKRLQRPVSSDSYSKAEVDKLLDTIEVPAPEVTWDDVTGKPATFPATAHTHDDRYYTETEMNTLLAGKQDVGVSSRGLGA